MPSSSRADQIPSNFLPPVLGVRNQIMCSWIASAGWLWQLCVLWWNIHWSVIATGCWPQCHCCWVMWDQWGADLPRLAQSAAIAVLIAPALLLSSLCYNPAYTGLNIPWHVHLSPLTGLLPNLLFSAHTPPASHLSQDVWVAGHSIQELQIC